MKARNLALSVLSLSISIPLATAYSGQMTFYTPAATPSDSSCDLASAPGESVVAISQYKMNNAGNPNNNPLCGTTISIYNPANGQTISDVKIVDTCMGCPEENIDVNVELFEALGFASSQGKVSVDWGGNSVGGKKRSGGVLEPVGIVAKGEKREVRHPHGRGE